MDDKDAEVRKLHAENERLREALRPFAEADFESWMATADCTIPIDAFRWARKLLEGTA